MPKIYLFSFLSCILISSNLQAQENIFEEIMETDVIKEDYNPKEDAETATAQAKKLLKTRSQNLRRQNFPKIRQRSSKMQSDDTSRYQPAPFGLVWGASIIDTKNQGVLLSPIEEKDYVNSFAAKNLPKPISEFERVNITFGDDNELWRIIAYGNLMDDDASCTTGLRQYQIYAALLKKKYGNQQENYTPAMIDVEETDSKGQTITVQKPAPLENPNLCKQLENGTAVLYSTFENKDVGAALALNVDGSGKSYIVIDYKNLRILRAREHQTLDAL